LSKVIYQADSRCSCLCFAISAAGRHHAGFKPTRLRAQSARLHHHMMASSQNSATLALIHQDFSTTVFIMSSAGLTCRISMLFQKAKPVLKVFFNSLLRRGFNNVENEMVQN